MTKRTTFVNRRIKSFIFVRICYVHGLKTKNNILTSCRPFFLLPVRINNTNLSRRRDVTRDPDINWKPAFERAAKVEENKKKIIIIIVIFSTKTLNSSPSSPPSSRTLFSHRFLQLPNRLLRNRKLLKNYPWTLRERVIP